MQIQICAMQRCGKSRGKKRKGRGLPWQLGCVYLRCESTCFAMWTWPSYAHAGECERAHTGIHVTHTHLQSHMDTEKPVIFLLTVNKTSWTQRGVRSYSSILHIFLNSDYSRFNPACLASSMFGPMTYICGVPSAGCCWTPVLSLSYSAFILPFSFILPYSLRSSIPFHFSFNTRANTFLLNHPTSSDDLLTEECSEMILYSSSIHPTKNHLHICLWLSSPGLISQHADLIQ